MTEELASALIEAVTNLKMYVDSRATDTFTLHEVRNIRAAFSYAEKTGTILQRDLY